MIAADGGTRSLYRPQRLVGNKEVAVVKLIALRAIPPAVLNGERVRDTQCVAPGTSGSGGEP